MDVTMPQLGETVTEGTITRWLKQVGEHVDADEPLFEVSTDKVDSEVPAPVAGVVTEILVPEGETVEVGTRLAVVGDGASGRGGGARVVETPPAPSRTAGTRTGAARRSRSRRHRSSPAPGAAPVASDGGTRRAARGVAGRADLRFRTGAAGTGGADSALTSPIVRRLVAEHGLDVATIQGSGPGGRITRKDVLDAAHANRAPGSPRPRPRRRPSTEPDAGAGARSREPVAGTRSRHPHRARAASPPVVAAPVVAAPVVAASPAGRDETIPFDNIRRRTAEHMVRSKATSAHVYTSVEVDYERVERVRAAHQAEWKARRGLLAHLPAVHRARVLRHRARVPEGECERR